MCNNDIYIYICYITKLAFFDLFLRYNHVFRVLWRCACACVCVCLLAVFVSRSVSVCLVLIVGTQKITREASVFGPTDDLGDASVIEVSTRGNVWLRQLVNAVN